MKSLSKLTVKPFTNHHFSLTGNSYMSPFPFLMGMARKPKRVRTAFNPSQLLQLEQAFEKNQYVVGQERKQLANSLQLSETQVRSASRALV